MNTPIDVIDEALADLESADALLPQRRQYAEAAVAALTDDRIVAHAVRALRSAGMENGPIGPHGQSEYDEVALADIARVVLGSVGGTP